MEINLVDGDASDAVLLDAVRSGDLVAYGVLFRRHAEPLRRAAFSYGTGVVEPHDLVAEAFVRVLLALRRGHGPRDGLRPYLLVTMRNLAAKRCSRENRVERYGDVSQLDFVPGAAPAVGCDEVAVERWKCRTVSSAFGTLPGRWREVLWALEVDGTTPRELAPQLGLSPNAVSSLAVRAREGLRRAYLEAQVPEASKPACKATRHRLAPWLRGDMSPHRAKLVTTHLDECTSCRAVATGLDEVNRELYPYMSPSSPVR
jgi:RNA polymerase sigma factor (sigma-70 family)